MANRKLVPIKAGDAILYVELLPSETTSGRPGRKRGSGEEGFRGEPKAVPDTAYDSLKAMLGQLSTGIKDAIKKSDPDEMVVEAKIAFGGKTQPIPFLVSASGDASLTVKVTWKRRS